MGLPSAERIKRRSQNAEPVGIKSSADEQKPHTRPTGWEELAQHSEVPSFSPGGK